MSAQSSFVNNSGFSQKQTQIQNQKQIQKMSQIQIQAVNFLSMTNADLREKILKEVSENPNLETEILEVGDGLAISKIK